MKHRTEDVLESGFSDHVLVCTNARDSEYACCAEASGDDVYEAVKSWLRDRGVFWSHVHVAETSCLGLCSAAGTAVAIQPRNRWFSDVLPEDVPELLEGEFGADASRLGLVGGDSVNGRSREELVDDVDDECDQEYRDQKTDNRRQRSEEQHTH